MAHFLCLIFLLLGLSASNAVAAIQPTPTVGSCASSKPTHVPAEGTIVGGCGGGPETYRPIEFRETNRYSTSAYCAAGPDCAIHGFQYAYTWTTYATLTCPANSISDGGSGCVCAAGFVEQNGACVEQIDPKCGPLKNQPLGLPSMGASYGQASLGDFTDKVGTPGTTCFPGGCEVTGNRSSCGSAAGEVTCVLDAPKFTGNSCSETDDTKPQESKCEAGMCEGTINGVMLCHPCKEKIASQQTAKKTEERQPDGTTKTTTTTKEKSTEMGPGGLHPSDGTGTGVPSGGGTPGNGTSRRIPPISLPSHLGWDPDIPIETTRETVKETDPATGKTRVTQTTTSSQVGSDGRVTSGVKRETWEEDPAGNRIGDKVVEKEESKKEEKKDFCAENPKHASCKESTWLGGSCGGAFNCDGDAIQCAMAKEQHKRACELIENKSPESELYQTEKDKQGNRTENLEGNETFDINSRISSADLLGGGQGVQDLPITVAGSSITLPLSRINPYLAALGNVLLAVSFLIAVRIIGRA